MANKETPDHVGKKWTFYSLNDIFFYTGKVNRELADLVNWIPLGTFDLLLGLAKIRFFY